MSDSYGGIKTMPATGIAGQVEAVLDKARGPVGRAALSEATGLPMSSIHGALGHLAAKGAITLQDIRGGTACRKEARR